MKNLYLLPGFLLLIFTSCRSNESILVKCNKMYESTLSCINKIDKTSKEEIQYAVSVCSFWNHDKMSELFSEDQLLKISQRLEEVMEKQTKNEILSWGGVFPEGTTVMEKQTKDEILFCYEMQDLQKMLGCVKNKMSTVFSLFQQAVCNQSFIQQLTGETFKE